MHFTAPPTLLKTLFALVVVGCSPRARLWRLVRGTPVTIGKYPVEVEIPRGAGFRAAVERSRSAGIAVRPATSSSCSRARSARRAISRPAATRSCSRLTPLELLRQAHARRRHAGRGPADRGLDLRASSAPRSTRARTCGTTPRAWSDAQILAAPAGAPKRIPRACSSPIPISSARARATSRVLRRAYRAMQRHLKRGMGGARRERVPYQHAVRGADHGLDRREGDRPAPASAT